MIRSLLMPCSLGLALGLVSCGSGGEEPPPAFQAFGGESSQQEVAGSVRSPTSSCKERPIVDTSDTCGSATVQLFQEKPTVYFILDVSGSMADRLKNEEKSKLDAAKEALSTVAGEIGHRVRYGLSVFPGEDPDLDVINPDAESKIFGCAPGDELFEIQEGDPVVCVNRKPNGDVLHAFRETVESLQAQGGTPLSPTLNKLIPTLTNQEGETAVVLVTDGSPNCNPHAACEVKDCEANRRGFSLLLENGDDLSCDEDFNCCDPDDVGKFIEYPGAGCVDIDASEAALSFLHDSGVKTYIIGVSGGGDFENDMNRLAIAGGTAREEDRSYFDVESLDELSNAVRIIGNELALSCSIALVERPPQANELNLYLDGKLLPSDDKNGWTIEAEDVLFHGQACEKIESGDVTEIQFVSGCRTIIR